jgi:ABC-2 type transport system permease protein
MKQRLRRILGLAIKERRQLLRDPRTRPLIFVSPIIQLLLFGYAVTTDVERAATFVVDHDRTAESRRLVEAFTAAGYFEIVGRSDRPSDLTAALDRGHAIAGLEIPAGFARDLTAGRGARVQFLTDGSNSNTATIVQAYAGQIVRRFALTSGGAGTGAVVPAGIELRTRAWFNPELSSRVYNVPAVIGTLLVLMCLLLTAMAVVREREVGTLEQLLVSPISAGELMLGKTLPVLGIALFDLALITTVAVLWFHVPLRGSLLDLLLGALVFIFAALALGLLISTLSKTQQEAFMTMFLLFFPMLILSGLLLPVHTMPPFFQWLTLLNPLRHFLDIVRAIFIKGAGLDVLWPSYVALLLLAGAIISAAVWRFRRTLG